MLGLFLHHLEAEPDETGALLAANLRESVLAETAANRETI
jgi:hypothetical protein